MYCVRNEEKGAFCGNQICHHDVFPASKSFVGVFMKFGANVVVQQACELRENRRSNSHAVLQGVNSICCCTVKRVIFRKQRTPWPIVCHVTHHGQYC